MTDNISVAENGALLNDSWDGAFEAVLRPHLPFLSSDEPLTGDADLPHLGLDSVGTVELLAALESTYKVRFLDDALHRENFATPDILWHTLRAMANPNT
ncbi:phosphopantetheine-binding protein [Streptomyces carpinensis]|uniref:Phosphopantetheine-binding protein n=1 Tax=Streptomyces carpinensis TaxID=66369 RepID=A0ABV1VZV6_9ACTN|nr:phosphopantetheine-binding protein [Streptomyces carpinensis]